MFPFRLLRILLHPFFLGLVLTLALIVFTPAWFSKYKIETTGSERFVGEKYNYFEDLDSDGQSERISIDLNNPSMVKFEIFRGTRIINSFKIAQAASGNKFLHAGSLFGTISRELLVFTVRNDSVFLSIINVLLNQPFLVRERFIDRQWPGQEDELPDAGIIELYDYDADGTKEVALFINTGYRRQPRNCYLYNLKTDALIKSPLSGAGSINPFIFDLAGDTLPEIIYGTVGSGNLDTSFPYTDQKGWLMVLDNKLNFISEPVLFEKHPCQISVVPVIDDQRKRLVVMNHYFGNDSFHSTIGIYSDKGECIRQQNLDHIEDLPGLLPGKDNQSILLLSDRVYKMSFSPHFDTILQLNKPILSNNLPLARLDADDDGEYEYVFQGNQIGLYYLATSDLTAFTPFSAGEELSPRLYFSIIKSGNQPPQIYAASHGMGATFTYSVNPYYRYRYLIYSVAYVIITVFLYIMYLIQQYRARMHYETRRRINELQLRSVKSQMDPHFTFNILNSIGSLYSNTENRTMADYLFGKYAKLLRQTIVTSDQPEVSLEQELDFVKNYLDIEKFRMNNEFTYTVNIDSKVDTTVSIPRMLIHTFVENAVKYAVRQVEYHATLEILGYMDNTRLNITITDNGPGFSGKRRSEVAGTGKGLAIVDEMVRLYFDMTRIRITYTIEEIFESGKCAGTRVNLKI